MSTSTPARARPCSSSCPATNGPRFEKVIEEHERYLLVEKTVAVDAVIGLGTRARANPTLPEPKAK